MKKKKVEKLKARCEENNSYRAAGIEVKSPHPDCMYAGTCASGEDL
ncbi:MAG: hypothetical protein HOP37_11475 [Cyclobacteriaceae bacterium]|nr:hypothetical protein [Cyclobacteriaceae bacterium]